MKILDFRKIASIVIIFLFNSIITTNLVLAWAPQVQSNYLKEAIRILPWFQYLMCRDYKNYLIEGIVEAEYQFWFMKSGNCSGLVKNLKKNKLRFIIGWNFQEKDIKTAAEFFHKKFEGLKSYVKDGNKRYSEIMFELGYYLHSINNSLKPPYFHKSNSTKHDPHSSGSCDRGYRR